jgi:hypothetical protein
MQTPVDINDRTPVRRRWWLEVAYVLAFYVVYSMIRNQFGSGGNFAVGPQRALDNALRIIDIERALGLYVELEIQRAFLDYGWFMTLWNIYYGSLHFVVTGGVMITMYLVAPHRYRRYRNILAATTGLALVGFSTFPLMPPRLVRTGLYWPSTTMSTPWLSSEGCGRSTPEPCSRSRISGPRCPACTSDGPCGVRWRLVH